MYTNDNFKTLQDELKKVTGLAYFNGNKTELVTFCPNCEKDRFNSKRSHGHLYISTSKPFFNCFRCDYGGSLQKLLYLLGINPTDIIKEEFINLDPKDFKYNKPSVEFDSPKKEVRLPIADNTFTSKIEYLHTRMKIDDLKSVPGLILDFEKFLKINNMTPDENQQNMLKSLQSNFVGFFTTRQSQIVCRNIDQDSEFRYYKYFTGKNLFFKDFYGVQSNPVKTSDNTIVLTEGIFDLFGAMNYNGFEELKSKSCMWAACLGNSYKELILSTLDFCRIPSAHFVILSDNDMGADAYKWIPNNALVRSLTVYWNGEGKDFGEERITPIKKIYNRIYKNGNQKQSDRLSNETNARKY